MHTAPTLPGWHHAPAFSREHAHRAVGPILGHPTRPQIRYFFPPEPDGAAGGGGGGAPAGAGSTGNGDGAPAGAGSTGNDPDGLGDPGKRALDAMKAERNTARAEAKAFRDLGLTVEQIAELKAARDAANGGPTPEQIRAEAKRDADREAAERYAGIARQSAVREQAGVLGFHNPAAALAMLDAAALAKVDVHDNVADAPAVKALLEDLGKREPYLLKSDRPPVADYRTAGIGGTGGSGRPDPGPGTARLEAAYASTSTK